jgi:hypothetical protein
MQNEITHDDVLKALSVLGERFNKTPSPQIVVMYHDGLSALMTRQQLAQAIRVIAFEDEFFPTPARIVEAGTGSFADAAAASWSELQASIREDRKHDLDEHARNALKDFGGWAVAKTWDSATVLRTRDKFLTEYVRRARAARVDVLSTLKALPAAERRELEVMR